MTMWIVDEGDARPFDRVGLPPRQSYGRDWIVVDAVDANDALTQAWQYDHDTHPATTEMDLFAVAYRHGRLDFSQEQP